MVPDLEDISLEIRSAIDNTAFGIGIGVTHEQEENTTAGHLQHDGVLVDIVREGGGWIEDRDGQARVNIGEDMRWTSFEKTFDVVG